MASSLTVDLCLFDMDGTIVSTTVAAESVWRDLCKDHGVDPEELFEHSHGSRSSEILARFFPQLDNTDNKLTFQLEQQMGANYLDTVSLIPGAKDLLLSLDRNPTTGEKLRGRKWAVVTSATSYLAFRWFKTILKDVGKPDVFVTGMDVTRGKPDPEGYAKARDELSAVWHCDSPQCVVFEDAPVGIKAGKAMGAYTIGITSTYDKAALFDAGADFVVPDLTQVTVTGNSNEGKITIAIGNALSKN
ncbi:2-deoxyglucose-6-phosphatase KNAG_0B04850 [Huiozyma naganishii CBS 8797]|uniref:2-deoxyglucose-6-phosphate phosphatase n=1 Tax=Huiozyma naganishii (strain ATCC MYA-139 / BCRC 22969 / CBS 8797 / KCTC 17520 / NBRC 10181 / NCYC 3082 / Yp74L-3) TaxID=1071383 RepID=J7S3V0_HUIN7|nr:hypothetical protein KNAG_0B04850 [Kazachstania naganishii CBS 8797]CCK68919.1 hypothetical protein KNAG_0B04850 [Kazachstania naganishii CBS 8797]